MSKLFRIENVIETDSYKGAFRSSEVSDALQDGWYLISAAHDPYGNPVWLLGRVSSCDCCPRRP